MRILIIGNLDGYITTAAHIAKKSGAHIQHVKTCDEAMTHLRAGRGCDVVLIDVYSDIKKFIETIDGERFFIPVVSCGINPDPEIVEKSILDGAKEYLPLPPNSELIAAVLSAVSEDSSDFVFKDDLMIKCVSLAKKIAKSEASVLITGESGTGKEVISKLIHKDSNRSNKPFISINCAAIPENLLESELFGYEKGAFTGANYQRIGKFEEANGGTLLLDEITEMEPKLQAKILRAIQERVIDRVGGSKPIKIDIRILATSNRDMKKAVKENQFREDLYFRLNVININIPPLRDRPDDIENLSNHFIEKYTKLNGIKDKKIMSKESMELLKSHTWEGNVRELENTVHRAVLLSSDNTINPDDLLIDMRNDYKKEKVSKEFEEKTVSECEKELIVSTLTHCLGNRTHAAKILGISIRTLRNKLNEYSKEGVEITQSDYNGKKTYGGIGY